MKEIEVGMPAFYAYKNNEGAGIVCGTVTEVFENHLTMADGECIEYYISENDIGKTFSTSKMEIRELYKKL